MAAQVIPKYLNCATILEICLLSLCHEFDLHSGDKTNIYLAFSEFTSILKAIFLS
jgi:hypothetical protein